MISAIRIDNYRCFSKLTLDLNSQNLFVGENGSGKSSVFDALVAIRELVIEGERCERVFPLDTVPRWFDGSGGTILQSFALQCWNGFGEPIEYGVAIRQDPNDGSSRIEREYVHEFARPLYLYENGSVTLYKDDHSQVISYPHDGVRSALLTIPTSKETSKLAWLKGQISAIYCFKIDPLRVSARSEKEAAKPSRDFSNFVSWYRRSAISDLALAADFLVAIKEVIPDLEALNPRDLGQGVYLMEASFRTGVTQGRVGVSLPQVYKLSLDELSDGQRALIILYAATHLLMVEDTLVCFDEPDNYLALREIQPWIQTIVDFAAEREAQFIVSSHHPEFYNLMARDNGIRFSKALGVSSAESFPQADTSLLPISEQVARGDL